jgi:hypothetical protein
MQLLVVGDVMLGRLVNQALTSKPPDYPWGDSLSLFVSADLRICNLECVLSDRGRPWSATSKVTHFRSDAKNVAVLNAAKIDLVSIANNHALDYEYDALFEMLGLLERGGIAHAGAGRNRLEAWRPATLMCGTTRVVMIACTDNEPGWEARRDRPGTCYVPTELKDARAQELLSRVADVKPESDCLIVSCHWALIGAIGLPTRTFDSVVSSLMRAQTLFLVIPHTCSAASNFVVAGQSCTAPGTSSATMQWMRSSATTNRAYLCSTLKKALLLGSACIQR